MFATSAGNSDSQGLGVWIEKPAGTRLDILVRNPITQELEPAKHYVRVPTKKGTFRVQAPFTIQQMKLRELAGEAGQYKRKTHKVKSGETLESIAKQYNTTWQVLFNLNRDRINSSDKIFPGQWLKIPPESSGLRGNSNNQSGSLSSQQTYHVKPDDTLSNISQQSGVSVAELQRINGIQNPKTLQAGQTIKLRVDDASKDNFGKPPTSRTSQSDSGSTISDVVDNIKEAWNDFNEAISGKKEGESATNANSPSNSVHIVKSGDTLTGIAQHHGVSAQNIARANGIDYHARIYIGQKLVIPKGAVSSGNSQDASKGNTSKPNTPINIQSTDDNDADGAPKTSINRKKPPIIFPLLEVPINQEGQLLPNYDWRKRVNEPGASQAVYDRNRSKGRKHAGRDLYTNINPINSAKKGGTVVSIAPGIILRVSSFYAGTSQVTIKHTTNDGREFLIRYGELDSNSIPSFSNNQSVEQGAVLGNTGVLKKSNGTPMSIVSGKSVSMLHFEYFNGNGEDLNRADNLTQRGANKYSRRSDIADPLDILLEGYNASFIKPISSSSTRLPISQLKISSQGEDFIKSFESILTTNDGNRSLYYNDDAGYCTVGWGHLVQGKVSCSSLNIRAKQDSISINRAQEIFDEDVVKKGELLVKKAINVPLYQNEFDALVSLAFNVGDLTKIAPKLCEKINNLEYTSGSREMLDITMAGGREMRGLVIRRQKEYKIFNDNVYELHQ